jgi:hypothetical protein
MRNKMKTALQNWEYHKKLYESCKNNQDYLEVLETKKDQIANADESLLSNNIINQDLLIKQNQNLFENFKNNKLITSRLGCVESRFILSYKFNKKIIGDFQNTENQTDDIVMKKNAGLYYKHSSDRDLVCSWWVDNAIELLSSPITTVVSCYLVLAYDLCLLSTLRVKNKIIGSYTDQTELIKLFENRKILVISNGIEDMQDSFKLGLQRIYNFKLPSFQIEFLKSPQTTLGMDYPHEHMKETTEKIIEEIDQKYSDFDTCLLCCGGYSAPIINILSKKHKNKNLLYFGSELYTFFGLYSHGIQKPTSRNRIFNLNNFLEISKKCPDSCKLIDGGKYWKL